MTRQRSFTLQRRDALQGRDAPSVVEGIEEDGKVTFKDQHGHTVGWRSQ